VPLIAIAPPTRYLSDYEASVRMVGGDPWTIDRATVDPATVVARAGGVLLAGGGDVDPARYGAEAHRAFDAAEPGRDAYEIELVQRALEEGLPVLAICRGLQLLNVARGGTLMQHIPEHVPHAVNHVLREPADAVAHSVAVADDGLLHRLLHDQLTDGVCRVNSRHHQAVQDVGTGLGVAARAPDGVIEALEDPDRLFCLGVQWHPENFWRTGEFRAIFEGFVRASDAGDRRQRP